MSDIDEESSKTGRFHQTSYEEMDVCMRTTMEITEYINK